MNKLKIIIHPSFLILLLIGLYGGFIKEVVSFSIIVFLHELGHFIGAKIFKVNYYSIHLTIIGCMIDLEDFSNLHLVKQTIINCAGIIINVILIICFSVMNMELLVEYNKLMLDFYETLEADEVIKFILEKCITFFDGFNYKKYNELI